MTASVIASLLGDMQPGNVPGASACWEFLRILFEVEARGDQAIGDGLVLWIVGKIHLPVAKVAASAVKSEVGPGNHSQVIRIRRVKQGVKVRKVGTSFGKFGEARVLDGALVIDILQNDDDDAVEVMGGCARGGPLSLFPLAFGRFRDLRFGLDLRQS